MLSPDDIQRLCERKYPAFLRSVVTGEPFFPMPIRFGRPSTAEDWDKLRRDISTLSSGNIGYRIEWAEVNTRRWGRQKLPERVWFEDEAEFVGALRKCSEVHTFRRNLEVTRNTCAALDGWLPANVMRLVEFSESWPGLLKVCCFFLLNPRPNRYVRELPIDVDTKFIERHVPILRSLLEFLLPVDAWTKTDRFEEQFGLRFDEPSIRFRILDPVLKEKLRLPMDDMATPLSQFMRLRWNSKLLIVENKMTFLTLPNLKNAVAVWGGGGAAELLTAVDWFGSCELFYWGDIDVHGFHILARLRRVFPAIHSVMMDTATFEQFSRIAIDAKPTIHERTGELTESERRAYVLVRDANRLLEQEKIPHSYIEHRLLSDIGF